MRLPVKASHLPPRIAAGAFILNSGLGKWSADDETAAQLHGFAVGAYPFLAKLKPRDFVRLLSATEMALGSTLLLPIIPSAVAGAGLAVFSGGLLGLYARTPGMRKQGTPFPTEQGIALAKDSWMMGIALGLVIDDLTDRPDKSEQQA
jgi:hypothetical protein